MIDPNGNALIRERIEQIQERIDKAAKRAGRNPAEIELISVTKGKSAAVVKTLLENGISKIGESYLNEALFKIKILADYELEWHMIGNIQHGKETQIALNFAEVHSVDRLQIAETLDKKASQFDRVLPVYLEFNVSGEETKHGWNAFEESQWEQMVPTLDRVINLPSLKIKGLMTMAPYSVNPEDARPYFKKLRKLRDYLSRNYPKANINGISMGMSGDFETAIEEGATVLRIGSALVGPR